MAPLGIAAGDFGDAGFEIDAEPFPEKEKDAGTNWWMTGREARAKPWSGEKEREEASFEKHAIGLVAGEVGRGADEREKADKADEEHAARKNVESEEKGGEQTGADDGHQHVIARREPEEGGSVPETRDTHGVGYSVEVLGSGKDAACPDETADLEEEGEKCGEINHANGAEEKPARNEAVSVAVSGIEGPAKNGGGAEIHGQRAFAISNIQARTG